MAITVPKFKSKKSAKPSAERSPSASVGSSMAMLSDKWQALTTRDQLALTALGLFLLIVVGGYGGYVLHQSANAQQANYEQAIEDYFWLRGQAGNLSDAPLDGTAPSLNEQVNTLLTQGGVQDVQVVPVGETVQLSFKHDNQAVVSNVISSLINAGMAISQLNIMQSPADGNITVQATVS